MIRAISGVVNPDTISTVFNTAAETGPALISSIMPVWLAKMPNKMLRMTGVVKKPRSVSEKRFAPVRWRSSTLTKTKKTKVTCPRSIMPNLKMLSAP